MKEVSWAYASTSIPWSVTVLQQEGYGRASYMNRMQVHLRKFIYVFAQVGYLRYKPHGLARVQVNLIGHLVPTMEIL
jgi:hypothetical protein